MQLPLTFYAQDTVTVARQLLGCYLVHLEGDETTLGRIVETEAYLVGDAAAHSFVGKTKRNALLFGPVGRAYVYFIYGMYYCFNVVSGQEDSGEAVLLRALEPVQGIPVMQRRRGMEKLSLLCSGPARLAQALAITPAHSGLALLDGPLQLWSADSLPALPPIDEADIVTTTRVGITKAKDLPLRFYLKDNPHVSRKG